MCLSFASLHSAGCARAALGGPGEGVHAPEVSEGAAAGREPGRAGVCRVHQGASSTTTL